MIALPLVLALLGGSAGAADLAGSSPAPSTNPLPEHWMADWGEVAETVHGEPVYLFGDTFLPVSGGYDMASNTVVVGEEVITNALASTTDGTDYWPLDMTIRGTCDLAMTALVLGSEIRRTGTGIWDFEHVDTDAWVINDPESEAGWRFAHKIDEGPWDGLDVLFLDGEAGLAVTQTAGGQDNTTEFWRFDPCDPTAPWREEEAYFPESHALFAPIHTADGWWGISQIFEGAVALWRADQAPGPYEWVRDWNLSGSHYNHSLNLINGEVWYRYSTSMEDGGRVVYERIEL